MFENIFDSSASIKVHTIISFVIFLKIFLFSKIVILLEPEIICGILGNSSNEKPSTILSGQ